LSSPASTDSELGHRENVLRYICGMALWPLVVMSLMLGTRPAEDRLLLLWIVTGLFWGFIMELVCIAKLARK